MVFCEGTCCDALFELRNVREGFIFLINRSASCIARKCQQNLGICSPVQIRFKRQGVGHGFDRGGDARDVCDLSGI